MRTRLASLLAFSIAASACGAASPRGSAARPIASATTTSSTTPPSTFTGRDVTLSQYRFRDGETLPALRIHFSTLGQPRRDSAGKITNAVLLQHWTSASSEALQTPEFASTLYAPGRPLDATRYFLVFVDNVGHGGSSKPSDGMHARFPRYGYRDMVDLQHRVVREVLGVERLHAIVGLSMGGMHAWMWAEAYPDEVGGIMPIVSLPARIAGRNLIWRRIVTRAIRTDVEWKGGEYLQPPRGWVQAFPLFRMLLDGVPHLQAGVTDVASADSFVDDAEAQARKMDANDVLYSLESSTDYAPEAELAKVRAKVTVLNFGDDEFNPVSLHALEALTATVPQARLVVQPGTTRSFGHLTQAHPSLWAEHVERFMRDLEER